MNELSGKVTLEASVSPSEDPAKVATAVGNIVGGGGASLDVNGLRVRLASGELSSLNRLRDQLRDRRIRAAVRRLMLKARRGNSMTLMLNRQAAFAGVVAVCSSPEESPLGPIYLYIDSGKIEAVIDWLTGYEPG